MNKFIFTSDKNYTQMAFNEIKKFIPDSRLVNHISQNICTVETKNNFLEISNIINNNCVFVRHICPVNFILEYKDNNEILNILTNNLEKIKSLIIQNKSFSTQTRLFLNEKNDLINNKIINDQINNLLNKNSNIKNPEQIISIVINNNKIFIGISESKYNLSSWPGGECRFKKDENLISRAEFKLLEAIDVFNLDLSKYKTALDLGAAPGGWTKVLLNNNLKVTAIDPALLSPKIINNPNVYHFKGLAQDFIKYDDKFDIIVNDMRMDTYESINLMKIYSKYISKNGLIIMTLKLRNTNTQTQTNKCLNILKNNFNILHARQLFHNRTEITVVLQKL